MKTIRFLLLASVLWCCSASALFFNHRTEETALTEAQKFEEQVGSWLGDTVILGPHRLVRAAVLPGGTISESGNSLGALLNCSSPSTMNLFLLFTSELEEKSESRGILPKLESVDSLLGKIDLDTKIIGELAANPLFARGTLNESAVARLGEIGAAFKVKLKTYKMIPIFLGASSDGGQIAEALLPYMKDRQSMVVCVAPDTEFADLFCGVDGMRDGMSPQANAVVSRLNQALGLEMRNVQLLSENERKHCAVVCVETAEQEEAYMHSINQSFINDFDGELIYALVRDVIRSQVLKTPAPDIPIFNSAMQKPYGCQVEVKLDGKVIGQYSTMPGRQELAKSLIVNAAKFCREDVKVPLTKDNVERIELSVGVISLAEELKFKSLEELYGKLKPGEEGALLTIDGKSAGFLPQVWNQVDSAEKFIGLLCRKLGKQPEDLLQEGSSLKIFNFVELTGLE